MKKAVYLTILTLFLGVGVIFAQTKTEKFKVDGSCESCKTRIEKTAKTVKGVRTAKWDEKSKMLEISYDESKASSMDVQKAVAKAGHDTQAVKADEKAYKALPQCCKYKK